jgi:hypothetical protein
MAKAKAKGRAGDRHAGTAKTFRFTDEELAEINLATTRHPTMKAAIMAGVRAVNGQNQTDWPAELRRLAAELEGHKQ